MRLNLHKAENKSYERPRKMQKTRNSRGFSSLAIILFLLLIPLILLIVTALPSSVNAGYRNVLLVAITGFSALIGVAALKR
jgi:hypothetical protein